MNNTKFIGRYLALGAVLTGATTLANAQNCGDPVLCGGDDGPFSSPLLCDTTATVPVPSDPQQFMLSVPQFDPAAYAPLHGTTADKITLKRVEVSLTSEAVDFDYQFTNTVSGDCVLQLNYDIVSSIQANATVGTPNLPLNIDLDNTRSIT